MSKCIIYALVDPRTKQIRYIGKSSSGLYRPKQHTCPSNLVASRNGKNLTKKQAWIVSLQNIGLVPEIIILESCTKDTLSDRERHWISRFSNLTNMTEGGEGVKGTVPWNKGTVGDPRSRGGVKKGSIPWNKGGHISEECKQKLREYNTGKIPGNATPVICLNDGKVYESTGRAAKAYGIKRATSIARVCTGERYHVHGLRFMYQKKGQGNEGDMANG